MWETLVDMSGHSLVGRDLEVRHLHVVSLCDSGLDDLDSGRFNHSSVVVKNQ